MPIGRLDMSGRPGANRAGPARSSVAPAVAGHRSGRARLTAEGRRAAAGLGPAARDSSPGPDLLQRVPAILYTADTGEIGRWHYVSPQIEAILGFSPEEWCSDRGLWADR